MIDSRNMQNKKVPWEQGISGNTEKIILELCGINPTKDNLMLKLLDTGCGNGRYLELFRKYLNINNLYGTEMSNIRVDEVSKKGFNCILIEDFGSRFPFNDEFFDIIFSSNVIEHIPKKYYFYYLKEVHRVLKKGGRFFIGTPNYPIKRLYDILKAFKTKMYKYYLLDDPTHCNKLSLKKLEKHLKNIFDKVHLEPSYILFEDKIKIIKSHRCKLRFLGDKINGYCVKD